MLDNVEAVVVIYKTIDLAKKSISSFRKFYPKMRLVVVDNSGGDSCTLFLRKLSIDDKNIALIENSTNLGHGVGLDIGIRAVKTKYVYTFESDTIMISGGIIEEMLKLFTSDDVYGVGETKYAISEPPFADCDSTNLLEHMKWVWPYAAVLSVEQYHKFPPFGHDRGTNAAPLAAAMRGIHQTGKEESMLLNFDTKKYVVHLYGGTRGRYGIYETLISKSLDNVTCITVVYKTIDLIKNAYESLRKFYPTIKYLIVDNSGGDDCTKFLEDLATKDPNLELIKLESNVGHGLGMEIGINHSSTDFLFIFDSDVIFYNGCFIEELLALMEENTYGAVWILHLDMAGKNIPANYKEMVLYYLFDGFWFINRNNYFLYPKLTKYGLPLFKAMLDIHKRKLDDIVLKEFPIKNYLKHLSGGTRAQYGDCEDIVPGFKGRKGDMYSDND